jgi:hypothetical protein
MEGAENVSSRVIRVSDCFADYLDKVASELTKKTGREYSQTEASAVLSSVNPPVIVVSAEKQDKKRERSGVFGF